MDAWSGRAVANAATLTVGLLVVLGAMAWSWSSHDTTLFAWSFATMAAGSLCLIGLATWNVRTQNALAAADGSDRMLVARLRRRAWWGEAATFAGLALLVACDGRRDGWPPSHPTDWLMIGFVVVSAVVLVRNRRHAFA